MCPCPSTYAARKFPSDLEGVETVHRPDVGVRSDAAAELKQEQRNQQRLQKLLTIEWRIAFITVR